MENKQNGRRSLLDQIFLHNKSPGLSINDFDNFDQMQNKTNYKSVISFQDHSVFDNIFLYSKSPSLSLHNFDNFGQMQNKTNYKSVQDHSVLDKIFLYSKPPSLSFKPPDIEVWQTSTSMLCSWDQHDCYLLYNRHAKGRNTSINPLLA